MRSGSDQSNLPDTPLINALFGSALGQDLRLTSDIDLLVEFKPNAKLGFLTLAQLQREYSAALRQTSRPSAQRRTEASYSRRVLAAAAILYAV